jgi:hypothetical protein
MPTSRISKRLRNLSFLLFFSALQIPAFANTSAMRKSFQWTFDGIPQRIEVDLNSAAYLHYRSKPRTWSYGAYITETPIFPVIMEVGNLLQSAASNVVDTEWDRVRYVLSFVQNIRYTDDVGGEYPRFPIETLIDGTGDCEDTAILLAAILDSWGLDCVLLSPAGHMALGLAVNGMEGTSYSLNGKKYYYVETSGRNWNIGEIPPKYAGQMKVITLPTSGSPRRTVEYVAPKNVNRNKLQFAVYRSTQHSGGAEGRVAYQYKVLLEGNEKLMNQVQEVRYQRQHVNFAEYREGNWIVKTNPGNQFEATWTAWRNAGIAVQVQFKNGQVSELMIREAAIEAAR